MLRDTMDLHQEMLDGSTKNVKDTGLHLKRMLDDVRELIAQLREGNSEGDLRKRKRGRGMMQGQNYNRNTSDDEVWDDEA